MGNKLSVRTDSKYRHLFNMVYIGVKYLLLLSNRGFDIETCIFLVIII